MNGDATVAVSGFSPVVHLNGGTLTLNHEPILNLTVTLQGHNVGTTRSTHMWYLRGAALDTYSPVRRTWMRGEQVSSTDQALSVPAGGRVLIAGTSPGIVVHASITLRTARDGTIFTLFPPAYVGGAGVDEVEFSPVDAQITLPKTPSSPFTYQVWQAGISSPQAVQAYRRLVEDRPGKRRLPAIGASARYARGWIAHLKPIRNLALSILRNQGLTRSVQADFTPHDPRIAQVLTDYLRNNFTYTLSNPPVGEDSDPIFDFLITRREGHCELFASGLAALARSLGMPARLVTGYVASDYNVVGGYYMVRQSDAHAWCEIEVAPDDWRTYDPTPAAALVSEYHPPRTWFTWARDLYDHIEFIWINSVLAYDNGTRNALLGGIRTSVRTAAGDEGTWMGSTVVWIRTQIQNWRFDALAYTIAAIIVAAIALGVLILLRIWIIRRRRLVALQLTRLPRSQRRRLASQLRFYLTMLDMLERHGWHRPAWQSPFAFAQDLAQDDPLRFEPVLALTEHFYEIRFGHRFMNAQRRRLIRVHLRRLEETLGQDA